MLRRTSAQRKIYPQLTIEQLPDNLLLLILRKLPQWDILSVSLVCHRWSALFDTYFVERFRLQVIPDVSEFKCADYLVFLNRSTRRYRKAEIIISGQQSLLVAVLALRRFGQCLYELKLTMSLRCYPSFLQLHFERMKELEMGLEQYDQLLWEQEVDSYDRGLRLIALVNQDAHPISPGSEKTTKRFRQIEEVFLPFVYRHCFRLCTLLIEYHRNLWDTQTSVLLYEAVEMKYLQVLQICGAGVIILADCPTLKSLTVQGTTTGVTFYQGLRNAFPQLIKLEIVNDFQFDDQCLLVISRRCTNLVELSISFTHNAISQKAFHHLHRMKKLKQLALSFEGPHHSTSCLTFENWPRLEIEKLVITIDELPVASIQEILLQNSKLSQFIISTRRKITYSTIRKLQSTRPTCQLTFRQLTSRQQYCR
ncbi:uncharacterized protein LOC129716545 [Wyeomyia smithii]|uniref:uncharacterized protein LOC129716545 n=1 Tax=Wyeomyia smithii TaxID=174621 RepID=UPI002467AF00|nr:uncharacterized protein LOC129716545 [Wyeomyia smithii]